MRVVTLLLTITMSVSSAYSAEPTAFNVTASTSSKGFDVVVHAPAGKEINQEAPIKLALKAPAGVVLSYTQKKDKHAITFSVIVASAGPGKHTVDGVADFYLCSKQSCDPQQAKFSHVIDIKKKNGP